MILEIWVVKMPDGDRPYTSAEPPALVAVRRWQAAGGRMFKLRAEVADYIDTSLHRGSATIEEQRSYTDLEWRIVHNAGRYSEKPVPRWVHVKNITGHGSTESADMCRRVGLDPDKVIPSYYGA